jgi:hypothetical protein
MYSFLPVFILLFTPICLLILHYWRPKFPYFWLIAVLASVFSWTLLLLSQFEIPTLITLIEWKPQEIFPTSPKLLLDDVSWAYGLSLSTILLSFILTSAARSNKQYINERELNNSHWLVWISSITVVGIGLIAVFAGDLITLLLSWTALDIFELLFRLSTTSKGTKNGRIILSFASRILAIIPIILAVAFTEPVNRTYDWTSLPPNITTYLIIAAVLRLGVIPVNLPPITLGFPRPQLQALFRFIPAATGLMLLTRAANAGLDSERTVWIIGISLLIAVLSSIKWSTQAGKQAQQPFWIISISMFMIAAAVRSQVDVCLSWGVALLLAGAMLSFYSARDKRLIWIVVIGVLGITTLPLTSNWYGVNFYEGSDLHIFYLFIIPQAFLIFGCVRQTIQPGSSSLSGIERLIWVIYPWGLFIFVVSQYVITFWVLYSSDQLGQPLPSLINSWPGLVASGFAITLFYFRKRWQKILPKEPTSTQTKQIQLSLERVPRLFFYTGEQLTHFIDRLVEGKGALLWTILLLTLIISLITNV